MRFVVEDCSSQIQLNYEILGLDIHCYHVSLIYYRSFDYYSAFHADDYEKDIKSEKN